MKGVFLFLLSLLAGIALIRFGYGLQANTLSYNISAFVHSLPNVKENFSVFIDACDTFVSACENVGFSFTVSPNPALLEVLAWVGNMLWSLAYSLITFIGIFFSLIQVLVLFIADGVQILQCIFNLLFAPAVNPIAPPA